MATAGSIVISLLMKTGAFETDSKRAEKRLQQMAKTAKQAGAVIGTAMVAAGTALALSIKRAIDYADSMDELSNRLSIGTETLTGWAYAAKLSGTSLEGLEKAIPRLSKNLADAQVEGSRMSDLFAELGVSTVDAAGNLRDVEDVLPELADRFKTLENDTQETALAMELFGRSGVEMLEFLNRGSEGITELTDRAERLGIVLDAETAAKAGELNDRLDDMRAMVEGLALTVAAELLPDIVELTDALADTIEEGGGMIEVGRDIADIFSGLAKVFKAADLAIDGMGERFNIAAQYKNMFLDPKGWKEYQAEIDAANARLAVLAQQNKDLALAARQDFGIDAKIMPIEDGSFTGRPPRARTGGTPMLDGENVVITPTDAQRDGWGSANRGGGNNAAAEAARKAAEAERALAEQIRDATRAQDDFLRMTEDLSAELGGPLAQVQLDYIRREDELIELAKLAGLTNDELAGSLDLLEAARLRDVDAIMKQAEAEAKRAQELADGPLIDRMDALRDTTAGFFTDLVMNGEDAIDRLQEYLLSVALESVGRQIAEGLFGDFGTTGSGSAGGWGAALSSFFGGGRAGGGDTIAGRGYLIGEQGPEMFIPRTAGTVIPADQTASMRGSGGPRNMHQTVNFNVQGKIDNRSRDQIASAMYRIQRQARDRGIA